MTRIGQEVIVDFLEGDPNPIITCSVYVADQMPPYPLTANATEIGIKSPSSKGGGIANFNEIPLEEKQGSEQVFIHAEKNQHIEVEIDEIHSVGHDRTKTIDHDETVVAKTNRTEERDAAITIDSSRTEDVGGKESISVGGNRTRSVTLNLPLYEAISRLLTRPYWGRREGDAQRRPRPRRLRWARLRASRLAWPAPRRWPGVEPETYWKSRTTTVGNNPPRASARTRS